MFRRGIKLLEEERKLWKHGKWIKVGPSIGTEKTFINETWDDSRHWNDQNIWDE